MTNEQYWMRRDRDAKMKSLYGCPMDLPENDDPLKPARGIVQALSFPLCWLASARSFISSLNLNVYEWIGSICNLYRGADD